MALDWEEISRRKDKFLDKRESILKRKLTTLENRLFVAILNEFVSKLEFDEDDFAIIDGKNIELVDAMDDLLTEFMGSEHRKLINQMLKDLSGVSNFNSKYFKSMVPVTKKIQDEARNLTLKSLGVTPSGNLKRNGYLDRLLKGSDIIQEVKSLSYSAVQGGVSKSQFTESLEEIVTGGENSGAFSRYHRTYANDLYSQVDRTETTLYAQRLDMPVARYAGGKVKDSRPFCLARQNKFILVDEIKRFGTKEDDFEKYARDEIANGGYTNHKQGEFQGKNKGYVAQRDLGGHNCIHRLNYVTPEIAIRRDNTLEMRDNKLVRK